MRTFTKIVLAFALVTSAVALLNAQTVNSLWVDGRIYFKIADHAVLNVSDDEGIINPKDVYFLDDLISEYQITEMRMPFKSAKSDVLQRTFRLDFENMENISGLIKVLNSHPDIEYAEPAPLFFISMTPDDPYYNADLSGGFLFGNANSSWHLNLINAAEAWDVTTGSSDIVVAVLDNAIWIDHPDLVNMISHAVDLGNGDNDPNPPEATYIWSHGTHSAGLIGAETNNGIGVASIGNGISIMAVKLGDDASDGQSMAAGFEGIVYAADNGADVINMSWGSPQFFQTMQNTVNYAYNKGCVLVGAAGNNGNGMETQMNPDIPINYMGYPAALEHVIAVGSCDVGDNKSDFSCYGTWIDVLAPGGYATQGLLGIGAFTILSTTYNDAGSAWDMINGTTGGANSYSVEGKYDLMQGTSMACPVTSGLCGLMLSANPDLTPEELTAILKATCDNVDAENAAFIDSIGAGRINAFAAVTAAQAAIADLVADFEASEVVIDVDASVDFTDLTTGTPNYWSWTFEGGTPNVSTEQHPTGIIYDTEGIFSVTLTASDGTNTDTETKTYFIIVGQSGDIAETAWIGQNTHFTSPYRGVWSTEIVDANTAWILTYDGGGSGGITRDFAITSDAGQTWIPKTLNIPTNYAIGDISAVSATTAWIAVYDATISSGGAIFKTIDAGDTWTQQTTALFENASSFANVIHMFNENDGYCQGDPANGEYEIYTTSDGGENWTKVDGANIPDPASSEGAWTGVANAVGDIAWFGTSTGRLYKTIDKGLTWTVHSTGEANVSTISFANELNGVVICQVIDQTAGTITSWKMKKTDDGGETWSAIPVEEQYLSDVSAVPGVIGMYVGTKISQTTENNFSAYTLDYGTTWTMLDDSIQYTNVKMFNEFTGWAGGFNMDANTGGIYKWVGLTPSDAPYFTSSPDLEVTEFETYTYNIVAIDPNDIELTLTAPTCPTWLSFTDNGNGTASLTGTAPEIAGITENFNVTLDATNGEYTGTQNFVIIVNTSNTAPYFTSTPITTHVQNTLYSYDVIAEDDQGDALTIEATTIPAWANFVDNGDGTGQLTGTPTSASFLGFGVVLKLSDGMFIAEQTFKIQVTANNIVDFGFGSIEIYPNPSTGIINVLNCQGAKYEIMDITGRIISQGNLDNSFERLDISELCQGNLFIRLFNNEIVYTVKIVKL
ncbi:MAG: S8 family serine peptidase [Bacteroidales bacterium]|nr:S8 family serine peptidase [Bacteroidales bacterium]MDD4216022.1 S8 family serine peptidase [Bacteroidales bacterium]MDY0140287.1 S8 family serine peptidase [Bacteroidales bacterium]